jgi:SAM-dependent methyltransferase
MRIEIAVAIGYLFNKSLGRLKYFNTFSADIEIIDNSDLAIKNILSKELNALNNKNIKPKFLDVGARDTSKSYYALGFDYHAMDMMPQADGVMVGNICNCPEISDDTFDVVFSLDVFEHLQRPWDAAQECIRIAKPNGLLIHRTLFSYRYHPEPVDYWRFSSQCLEYLFTNTEKASTVLKGYDIRGRRRNRLGKHLNHRPPIDWLGGFRENWQVLWIGRKNSVGK